MSILRDAISANKNSSKQKKDNENSLLRQAISEAKTGKSSTAEASSNVKTPTRTTGIVSQIAQKVSDLSKSVSPADKKAYRENQYASSTISGPRLLPTAENTDTSRFADTPSSGSFSVFDISPESVLDAQTERAERLKRQDEAWDTVTSKPALYAGSIIQTMDASLPLLLENTKQSIQNLSETWNTPGYSEAVAELNSAQKNLERITQEATQQARSLFPDTPASVLGSYITSDNPMYQEYLSALEAVNEAQARVDAMKVTTPVSMDSAPMKAYARAQESGQRFLDGLEGWQRTAGEIGLSIGQNAATLPTAALNPSAPLALMGTMAAANKTYELNTRGADPAEALTRGIVSGGIEAATEKIPLDHVMKLARSGGLGSFAKNIFKQSGIEATEEAVSYFANYLADLAFQDPSASFSVSELLYNAFAGGVSGGLFGLGGTAFGRARNALGTRASVTQQAETNLSNPDFVRSTTQEAIDRFNQNYTPRYLPVADNPLVNMLPTASEALYYAPGSPAYRGSQASQNVQMQEEVSTHTAPAESPAESFPAANEQLTSLPTQDSLGQSAITDEEWASIMASDPENTLPTVNGPESSVGAARKGFDPWSEFQGTKSEFFPEGANAARPVDVPTTDKQGNPIRKTASTVMGAKAIPDNVVLDIQNMVMNGNLSYQVATDRAAITKAISTIQADGFQRSLQQFSDSVQKGIVSKDMAAMGQQLLINAANAGDADATAEILSLYAQMETTASQAVQAASILRKLSPSSQLYAAQKVASNLEKTLSKSLKGKNIKIDHALIEEFNQQTDQAGRDFVMEKIYKNIAQQVPSTWRDKWNAWRYLSMLGNPRTHIRNIVGNVGFQPVRFMKDRIAAVIESGVSVASGGKLQRTKSFAYNPALYAAAWQDFDNVSDVLSGNKYDDVQSIINDNRTIFKTKPLETLRKFNTNALSFEDMWFKRITYAGALSGYLNANGVTADQLKSGNVDPNLLSAARDYAGQEALKATYNDRNVVSDKVIQAARALGPFGEAVLPFKRTPANIFVRGFEYSPLGLVKWLTYDLYQVKQGNMTGAQAIDNIAAGMTGSGLMLLGGLLAAAGIVSGGAGDDEKQAQFNELTGGQTYALNLPGGGSVTLDWLAPEALPFFMGVQAMESFGEEGLTGDTITSAFASISEPMLEMSMLQSLNDLIDNVSYAASNEKLSGLVGSSLISYLTQAIPTIGGQIERTFEDKRYSTYTNKDSLLPTDIQYALGKASAKIPGWDFQQVPYIDAWGREEETGLLPMRALNNFLNPAYTSSLNVTPVDEEIQRLYNATGVGSVIPSRADKSITVDGEAINLSGDKYVEYAKTKGGTAFDLLSSIIDTSAYKGLSDDEKVKLISDVYEYANSVGKAAVSSYKPEGFSAKVQSTGVDPADYILYRSTADADNNGTVTQSEAASALLPMKNLSNAEKGKVWQSQNSSWNEKKNPFTGALVSAGITPETATNILKKYSELQNQEMNQGSYTKDQKQRNTELSKYLDGLGLSSSQREVVDNTYAFLASFDPGLNSYSVNTMSKAAQEKWPAAKQWGLSEEQYLTYYPIVSSSKEGVTKEMKLQQLQDAGMTYEQAKYFWDLVKSK